METSEQPPRNPLYPWLRFLLWILPTGFLVISVGGLFMIGNNIRIGEMMVIALSILLNVFFVIGTGWCDYQLSQPARKEHRTPGMAVLLFFLSQIFLVPILLGAVVFAVCSLAR